MYLRTSPPAESESRSVAAAGRRRRSRRESKPLPPWSIVLGAVLLTLTWGLAPARAQQPEGERDVTAVARTGNGLQLGILGGISFADARGNIEGNGDFVGARSGFAVGALARYPLGESVELQGELLFVRRVSGAAGDGAGLAAEADYEITGDFLQVPVLLRYRTGSVAALRPALYAGPVVGYTLSVTRTLTISSTTNSLDLLEGGTDLGLAVGVGTDLDMGSNVLTLDARYVHGLRDLDESPVTGGDIRFGSLSFLAGVIL